MKYSHHIGFIVILLSVVFTAFPGWDDYLDSDYKSVELTESDLEWMRMYKYMNETEYYKSWFLLSDTKVPLITIVNQVGDKLIILILLGMLMKFHSAWGFILALWVVDLVDYFVTYNEVWFSKITWNILSVLLYGLYWLYYLTQTPLSSQGIRRRS